MNGNGILATAHLLGQPKQQAPDGNAIGLTMYVRLVPELAMFRIARGYEVEGGLTEPATPQRIAQEARAIVEAALDTITVRTG